MESEEAYHLHLAAIVESADLAILSKTLAGVITSWNSGAERLYGYLREEVIGRRIELIVPPERADELTDIFLRLQRGESIPVFETIRLCKDGTRIEVTMQISPIKTPDGRIIGASAMARDITERKQIEEQMAQLHAEATTRTLMLDTANRVALDILVSRTGVEALRSIAEAARRLSGATYAALGVARPGTCDLIEFITVGLEPQQELVLGAPPIGRGVLGLLLRGREPLRIDRLDEHPDSAGFPPHHPRMQSFLGVPIVQGETTLGALYLTDKAGATAFTEADQVAVQALGAYTAVAIQNLHTLTRQRMLVRGLIEAQEAERKAVAYDLHDGLTQFVMASHAHFESFRTARRKGNEVRAERALEQGMHLLKEAVTESRRLVNGLRALALDDLGLVGALEQLVEEEKQRADWQEVEFRHNLLGRRFEDTLETALYRVVQEALTNARKYARSPKVAVTLIASTEAQTGVEQLMLDVRDW
ncbi:MAG: hypothetical protein JWN14_4830 [Chthonomonadales bacterium]|nr:hypothetical protein [Chthonomonadales bacterium]